MKNIFIEIIPHKHQRYDTAGDYFKALNEWIFRISKLNNNDYEFLVIIHELIEWYLTQKRGISEPSISRFDIMFEKERVKGLWKDEEPGNDKRAPYRKEHQFAEKIEKQLAKELKVNWKKYENKFLNLEYK